MLFLSDASVQMSKYIRDDQKQEWYDEPIYICIDYNCYKVEDEIMAECKRCKIQYDYIPMVVDYCEIHRARSDTMHKLCIFGTGLKVKQLADWAITTYNFEEMYLHPYDPRAYSVWIQPQREVRVGSCIYDEDGCRHGCVEHWRTGL